jgi:hypothetical protein
MGKGETQSARQRAARQKARELSRGKPSPTLVAEKPNLNRRLEQAIAACTPYGRPIVDDVDEVLASYDGEDSDIRRRIIRNLVDDESSSYWRLNHAMGGLQEVLEADGVRDERLEGRAHVLLTQMMLQTQVVDESADYY